MSTPFAKCCLGAITAFLFAGAVIADETAAEGAQIMSMIRAAWEANQGRIHSIECSGTRQAVCVKDGYTNSLPGVKDPQPFPAEDRSFTDEPFRWVIDFDGVRIRRETEFTKPLFKQGMNNPPFVKNVTIDLINKNEYRYFRSTKEKPSNDGTEWKVQISSNVLPFMESDSLPLLWLAGSVSAQTPSLTRLKTIDEPSACSFKGTAQRDGKDYYLITMNEGKSGGSAVREYWVEAQAPYRIVSCLLRTQRGVPWQLDVQYQAAQGGGELFPHIITYIEFVYPTTAIRLEFKYRFDEFHVNRTLDDRVFEKSLEPGMMVNYPGKKGTFQVDSHGNIGPYTGAQKSNLRNVIWRVVLISIGCVALAYVFWRAVRRRRISTAF